MSKKSRVLGPYKASKSGYRKQFSTRKTRVENMKPAYNGATTTKNTFFWTRSPEFLAHTKQAKAATKSNLAQKNTREKIKPEHNSATTTNNPPGSYTRNAGENDF